MQKFAQLLFNDLIISYSL